MTTSSPTIVFLEQEYSYRNVWFGGFFLIFGSVAGLMLAGFAVWFTKFPAEFAAGQAAWWEPLAMLAWVTPFVGLAGYIAWLFLWRPRWLVRIDERGITFGHQFFGWERIKSRWRFALDRGLPLSPTLTAEQAEELLDWLDEFLSERFPEVEVG